ncbi:unnamed protein product, partial [Amoebophrya sp. A25]
GRESESCRRTTRGPSVEGTRTCSDEDDNDTGDRTAGRAARSVISSDVPEGQRSSWSTTTTSGDVSVSTTSTSSTTEECAAYGGKNMDDVDDEQQENA